MPIEPLPLPFIGWVFTIVSAAALIVGGGILFMLYRGDGLARRYAESSFWNDVVLLTIWSAGLLGGIGVLLGQPWSRPLLEFFCWVISALTLLSGASRLVALRRDAAKGVPVNWVHAIASLLVVAVPIVALSAVAIVTLRSEAARQALGGS